MLSHLEHDPEQVRRIALERVQVRRERARGDALAMLDEWTRILIARDWDDVRAHLAVFGGVLSQDERRAVLDAVYTEIDAASAADAADR